MTDQSAERALYDAAEAVRRDVAGTRAWDASAHDALAGAVRSRRWWLSQWPEGAPYVRGLLAQDVQEALHAAADPTWPLCPEHLDHALYVEPDLGDDPFWVCHRSGLPVAQVGELSGSGREPAT